MPKQYTYLGPSVQLGRFGFVKRGDVIHLTDKEEEAILADKDSRFRPFKEGEKIEGAGVDVPSGFTDRSPAEQKTILRKLEDDKRRREEFERQATNPTAGLSGAGATGQPLSEAEERARQDQLQRANNEAEAEELRQMTKQELLDYADSETKANGTEWDFKKDSAKRVILLEILNKKGFSTEDVEEDEEP